MKKFRSRNLVLFRILSIAAILVLGCIVCFVLIRGIISLIPPTFAFGTVTSDCSTAGKLARDKSTGYTSNACVITMHVTNITDKTVTRDWEGIGGGPVSNPRIRIYSGSSYCNARIGNDFTVDYDTFSPHEAKNIQLACNDPINYPNETEDQHPTSIVIPGFNRVALPIN